MGVPSPPSHFRGLFSLQSGETEEKECGIGRTCRLMQHLIHLRGRERHISPSRFLSMRVRGIVSPSDVVTKKPSCREIAFERGTGGSLASAVAVVGWVGYQR